MRHWMLSNPSLPIEIRKPMTNLFQNQLELRKLFKAFFPDEETDLDEIADWWLAKFASCQQEWQETVVGALKEEKIEVGSHSSVNGIRRCVSCIGCEEEHFNTVLDHAIKIIKG